MATFAEEGSDWERTEVEKSLGVDLGDAGHLLFLPLGGFHMALSSVYFDLLHSCHYSSSLNTPKCIFRYDTVL